MTLIGPTPIPALADQCADHGWPFGFYHFHDATPANEYFNPALVHWQERDWLVVRRRQGPPSTPGRNTLEAWTLKNNQPGRRVPLTIPGASADESAEDPRALVRGKALIINFCQFVPGQGFAHQAMTGVLSQGALLQVETPVHVKFGSNGLIRAENTGHEKNWLAMCREDGLWLSYSMSGGRHITIRTRMAKAEQVLYGTAPTWPWGELRGGSNPVLVDGLWWTFFHSYTPWYCLKRRYYMGVVAFEDHPPFNVVRVSRAPLLAASERDPRNPWAPPCVWPAGAILRDGQWLVSLGVNDCACAWVQMPHVDVERSCYVTA